MSSTALHDPQQKPLLYRLIRRTVSFFSPKFRVVGAKTLPTEPCVLVGNHCHMYGPIAAELYLPGAHYTWCAGEMMHRREVADYAYQDFWSSKPVGARWFYRLLSHVIAPLSEFIFTNANTIPVYHDMRLISTFRRSIQYLDNGASIVIFPERNQPYNGILWQFQDKFIDLARLYYKRTGTAISFVPMYIAPSLKSVYLGEPIQYRPLFPIDEERKRICEAIMTSITEMAVKLPRHTVVPYPNLPRRRYPRNIQ